MRSRGSRLTSRRPWFEFLAQLGALTALHQGSRVLPGEAETWSTTLAGLAGDAAASAWSLVGGTPEKPAFLQPSTSRFGEYKRFATTPDGLDVLVTAKNHDRKRAQAIGGDTHLWLYALVNLQTQQGYSGRGQPGVARMNGGFASRVLVDRRPNDRWGQRVERAIRMLLTRRDEVFRSVDQALYRSAEGLALTWLRDWDEDQMLSLSELDPYFIEVWPAREARADTGGRRRSLGATREETPDRCESLPRKSRRPLGSAGSAQVAAYSLDRGRGGF